MKLPAGRYVAVRASLAQLCPVCHGRRRVQWLDVTAPYGPLAVLRLCPHCTGVDPETVEPVPLIHLPAYNDRRTP